MIRVLVISPDESRWPLDSCNPSHLASKPSSLETNQSSFGHAHGVSEASTMVSTIATIKLTLVLVLQVPTLETRSSSLSSSLSKHRLSHYFLATAIGYAFD